MQLVAPSSVFELFASEGEDVVFTSALRKMAAKSSESGEILVREFEKWQATTSSEAVFLLEVSIKAKRSPDIFHMYHFPGGRVSIPIRSRSHTLRFSSSLV